MTKKTGFTKESGNQRTATTSKKARKESVAVLRMAEKPANWRDTDIQNTGYWACSPK